MVRWHGQVGRPRDIELKVTAVFGSRGKQKAPVFRVDRYGHVRRAPHPKRKAANVDSQACGFRGFARQVGSGVRHNLSLAAQSRSEGSAEAGSAGTRNGPGNAGNFAMSENSFFGPQTHAHHLGRLVGELSGVLGFWSFLHYALCPISGGLSNGCCRQCSPRQNNLRKNSEREEKSSSLLRANARRLLP